MTDTWKNPLWKPEIGTRVCYNTGVFGTCYRFGIVSHHTPTTFQIQIVYIKVTVIKSGGASYSIHEVEAKPLWDQPIRELVTCRFYKNSYKNYGWATREDNFTCSIHPFKEEKSYINYYDYN